MNIATVTWSFIILLSALSVTLKLSADTYDPSSSVFLFQKQMAKRGNAESQYKLGLMYETGSGVNASSALATSWYKKAARQNYKPASNRLTYLDIKRSGFNDSHTQWLKALKSEARFNDGEALFLLGQMYSEGTGVNKSLTRSLKYLHKAAGGNIPGSEAEISRVEAELDLLQKQYISEEEKQNTAPLLIAPAQKVVVSPPKPITPKVTASTKKPKPKTTQKSLSVAKNTPKTQKKSVTQAPPKPPAQEIEAHPMDSICGGRNRFSRGCR